MKSIKGIYKRLLMLVIALAVMGAIYPGQVWGQDSLNVSLVGHVYNGDFWYQLNDVAVSGDYAYLSAAAGGLRIIDISDIGDPVEISWLPLTGDGCAFDLRVADDVVYLACRYYVMCIDVSDVYDPQLLSVIDDLLYVEDIDIFGNWLYFVQPEDSVMNIADISDPANPVVVSEITFDFEPEIVEAIEGYAYVADLDDIKIIDTSDPLMPREIYELIQIVPNVHINDMTIGGNYLYLLDYTGNVRALSIENPAEFSGSHEWVEGICNHPMDIEYANDFLYISGQSLSIVDASTPYLVQTDEYDFPQLTYDLNFGYGLGYIEGMTAVAQGDEGLFFYDVSNPWYIEFISSIDNCGRIVDSEIQGNYAFTACEKMGFRCVDISNPGNTYEAGSLLNGRINHVRLKDSLAVLGDDRYGIRLADISDPYDIQEIAEMDLNADFIKEIVLDDTIVYVLIGSSGPPGEQGVEIIDISNPADPQEIQFIDCTLFDYMVKKDDYLYLGWVDQLLIYDVSDPGMPAQCALIPINWGLKGMAVEGNMLFLGIQDEGVMVYDLADPADPEWVSTFDLAYIDQICSRGNHLFVRTYNSPTRLYIIDISNPQALNISGYYTDIGNLYDVEIADDLLYLSGGFNYS